MPTDQRFADLINRVRSQLEKQPNQPSAPIQRAVPDYPTGLRLFFTSDGNAAPWLGEGWSPPEPHGCWAMGPSAQIELRLADGRPGDLLLEVTGEPLVHEKRREQRIRVYSGTSLAAVWSAREPGEFATILFGHTIADRSVRLRFELPDAVSPTELGVAQDSRRLAFSFYSMRLSTLS